jgi:hypothetical protein
VINVRDHGDRANQLGRRRHPGSIWAEARADAYRDVATIALSLDVRRLCRLLSLKVTKLSHPAALPAAV